MIAYYRWFLWFWRERKAGMTGVFLLTIATTAAKTALPIVLVLAIDALSGAVKPSSSDVFTQWLYAFIGQNPGYTYEQQALRLIGVYLVFAVVTELFTRALPLSRAAMNLHFAARIRDRYYDVFTRRNTAFFRAFRTGDLTSRLTDDVDSQADRISWYTCSGILRPFEALLLLSLTIGAMLMYSWELTLWSFLPLPVLVWLLARTEDKMVQYTDAKQQSVSECYDALEACFSGIRVVKSTMSEEDQLHKYEAVLERRVQREQDFLKINQLLTFVSMLVNHSGTIIVIFVGSYLTVEHRISLGQLLLFIIYLQRLVDPLWTLSWFYASSRQVFRYVDRLRETEDPKYAAATPPAVETEPFRSLELRNVCFRYTPESAQETLHTISLSVEPGELIAVTGPVGSGKTTLLELIVDNLQASSGELLFNGQPQRVYSIGYIRQETVLFSETVAANLRLGEEFSDCDLQAALDTSMLSRDIERFPEGTQTMLGQRGISLSGGQRQRLSIARTLVRRPTLLLMDDCTAAMDAETEHRFWAAFRQEMPGTTCIIVTHRMATAQQADRILVIDRGQIVEQGTHAELSAQRGFYNKFMQHQAIEEHLGA